MGLFQGIGILVGLYTLICVLRGEVHAKRGPVGMDTYNRQDQPGRFWSTVVIYGVLSVLLLTVF